MKKLLGALGVAMTGLLVACAVAPADGGKEDVSSETSDLSGVAGKTQVVGSLDYGDTSPATKYTSTPTYRAYKFAGNAGDVVDAKVHSANGDTVAWLFDNNWKQLGFSDDADGSTDSHIKATLPANASVTHYIVVREYYRSPMSFTVHLAGKPDLLSCKVDADCVRVEAGCCPIGNYTAVHAGMEAAYQTSLACRVPQICPKIMIRDDHSMAECNAGKCAIVKPANIACGGYTMNPHSCPSGFVCHSARLAVDAPGSCSQTCGGLAGRACDNVNETCVDNPDDSCDPLHGGADCGGICVP